MYATASSGRLPITHAQKNTQSMEGRKTVKAAQARRLPNIEIPSSTHGLRDHVRIK